MLGFEDILAGSQIAGARPYQEDDFLLKRFREPDPDGCDVLMVLADGMGGQRGGATASRIAVSAFAARFLQASGGVVARLRASLDAANAAVGSHAAGDRRCRGMGCTLVGFVVTADELAHWISVGDSPLWHLPAATKGNGADTERLNEDHSMRPVLEELARQGRLTKEEARRGSHQLLSAVMGQELPKVDEGASPVKLRAGDRIVLASDGLEVLSETEIRRLCDRRRTAEAIVSDLLQAVEAQSKPHQDNATAVVYQHLAPAAVSRRLKRLTAVTLTTRGRK